MEGYKFANSYISKQAMIPQLELNRNRLDQQRIQEKIERIQRSAYVELKSINQNIQKLNKVNTRDNIVYLR